jgi:flagellar hook assembly protein FlgD
LVDEVRPAGRHQAAWDGRDNAGNAMASGTYLYRFEADGRSLARKMQLLK